MANPVAPVAATLPEHALHAEPAVFGISASGFVALSMLVVVAIILWKRVPALIAGMLDRKIATIRTQLDEAAALRGEAEALLAAAKSREAASQGDAATIVAHAEAEAQMIRAQAEADAAELAERRGRMAEDKIGAAERAALADLRATAARAATQAAAALIAERHDAANDRALVDRTIGGLGRA